MTKRWYVVCSEFKACYVKDTDAVWTVSRHPDKEGWNTDDAAPGYGLTK